MERRPRLAERVFSEAELEFARARAAAPAATWQRASRPRRRRRRRSASGACGCTRSRSRAAATSRRALVLSGSAAEAAREAGVSLAVSLTHSRELAAAAVVTRAGGPRGPRCRRAGSSRSYDAETMRAVDSWAIEDAGRALAGADGGGRPGGRRGGARGARRARSGSSAARATTAATGWSPHATSPTPGIEVEVLLLWPADELSADAARQPRAARGRRARARRPAELERGARGLGRGGRRDLRHRLLGRPARAGRRARSRRSTPARRPVVAADIASGVDASTGEVEGAAVEAEVDGHASTPPSSATGSPPASATRGELRVARDRDPRRRARRGAAAG